MLPNTPYLIKIKFVKAISERYFWDHKNQKFNSLSSDVTWDCYWHLLSLLQIMAWHLLGWCWCMVKPSVAEPMRPWLKTWSISHWEKKKKKNFPQIYAEIQRFQTQLKTAFQLSSSNRWYLIANFTSTYVQGRNFNGVWIKIFHLSKSQLLSVKWQPFCSGLHVFTHKQLEMHASVVNTVATDVLVLKHQAISIHSAEYIYLYIYSFNCSAASIEVKRAVQPIFDWAAHSHLGKGSMWPLKISICIQWNINCPYLW